MNSLKAKVCFSYYLLFYLSIWREISVKYFESELVNSWHKIGLVCSICPWKLWLQNKSWKKRRLIFSWRLHLLLLLKFSFHAPTIILFTILQVSFFHDYHHCLCHTMITSAPDKFFLQITFLLHVTRIFSLCCVECHLPVKVKIELPLFYFILCTHLKIPSSKLITPLHLFLQATVHVIALDLVFSS